ncbi:MAG: hypothetical protein QM802_19230 [Agriterribacter sp.]
MRLFDIFRKKEAVESMPSKVDDRIKYFYEHPETLVDIVFSNRTKQTVHIWVELACVAIELDHETEYKIVTHDRYFRMEFDKHNQVVFYLQYSFGFKLYKRAISKDIPSKINWQLDLDYSDIN